MALSPAICQKCEEWILVAPNDIFVVCPICEKNISVDDSIERMDDFVSVPGNITKIIDKAIRIERKHGPQLPLFVLAKVEEAFPYHEEIAFLLVRMSGYRELAVRRYLNKFASVEKTAPFAEEFLDNALKLKFMQNANEFETYIENKLHKDKQKKYIEILRELRIEYIGSAKDGEGNTFLYTYYVACSAVNLGLAITFLIADWRLMFTVMIALAAVFIQIGLLYLHYKRYGNRINIRPLERHLMVIFMSSIIVIIGFTFLGALI